MADMEFDCSGPCSREQSNADPLLCIRTKMHSSGLLPVGTEKEGQGCSDSPAWDFASVLSSDLVGTLCFKCFKCLRTLPCCLLPVIWSGVENMTICNHYRLHHFLSLYHI